MRTRSQGICRLVLILCAWPALCRATSPTDEYSKLISSAQDVTALGAHPFGENVDLYTGALSFEITDINVPGTGPTLELGRVLKTAEDSLDAEDAITGKGGFFRPFGEWDLDIPRIETNAAWQMGVGGWVVGSGSKNRCTGFSAPPPVPSTSPPDFDWQPDRWWYGYHLIIPGQGSQDLLDGGNPPAHQPAGGGYPIVTKKDWMIGCGVTANDGGEGFVALAPDGTRYTFAHLVYRTMPWTERPNGSTGDVMKNDGDYLARYDVAMFVTQIKDRFGNTLTYNWTSGDPTDPVNNRLTGIVASDGRQLTLTYVPGTGLIQTATLSAPNTPARTWTYIYGGDADFPSLTQVQLPDGSAWSYQIGNLESVTLNTQGGSCVNDKLPLLSSGPASGSMTHPSGLMATFTIAPILHGRSYVNKQCWSPYSGSTTTYATIPNEYYQYSLTEEDISGSGVSAGTNTCTSGISCWKYTYSPTNQSWTSDPCAQTNSCPTTVYTDVLDPLGHDVRHTFSNRLDASESLLQRRDEYSGAVGSAILRSEIESYADPTGGPWPGDYGRNLQTRENYAEVEELSPLQKRVISQDGATFTSTVNTFDNYARSVSETDSSSLSFSKTVSTLYYDDLTHWVLGQISSTAVNGAAAPCASGNTALASCSTYYSSTGLPYQSYAFGKLVSTKVWNSDGTLHTITDGNTHTTTFSNWYRGVPQNIGYADGTSQSAAVDGNGWITSITDENLYTTSYGYDPMGRLSSITYPAGDSVNWNSTTLLFQQVGGAEFGIPAGHWRQIVTTGDETAITYFDAFWRPLVTERYDASNPGPTLSQTVTRYDADGRNVFVSYPINNLSDYSSSSLLGTHTYYDALNRVTEVDRNSELDSTLGPLKTKTVYLSGFKTQITEPNNVIDSGNHITTTAYMAFDSPITDWPASVTSSENETTSIHRDVFGKPLSITRSGGGKSLTRSFVYDANQQLCERIDPESGLTVMHYDGAGNMDWSAAGLTAPATPNCINDTTGAYSSGRRLDRTYDNRNRLKTLNYPDGLSNTSYNYYPDGALQSQSMDNGENPVATSYSYNKRRLLTGESLSVPNLSPMSIGYGYDPNGHLASTVYPDGRSITYAANALGQPTQAGSYATGVSYFPNGAIKQFTYGDGTLHTLTQNQRQLPDESTDTYGGTAVLHTGRDYDPDGNVAAITDYLPGNVGNVSMSYDGLDRLKQAISPMFGGDNKAVYTYDTLDNPSSARVGNYSNFNYQYDATNRLSKLTNPVSGNAIVTYYWDLQGNLATKNGQTYQFDMGNRLRAVPGLASYLYDGTGLRVQKTETASGTKLYADYSKSGMLMYQWNPDTFEATDYIYLGGSQVAKVVNNESQVIGNIDGVSSDGSAVTGWACSTGIVTPISVQLYVGGPYGGDDGAEGTLIATVTANQPSDSTIAAACHTSGTTYRFSIPLTTSVRSQYPNEPIYVYGLSPVGNPVGELTGSGQYTVPVNPSAPPPPASVTVPSSNVGGSFTVSWALSNGATSYVLQQEFNMMPEWNQVYAGSSTSTTVSVGSGEFMYRVQACNANGCSAFSAPSSWVTVIPAAPASITVPASSYKASFNVSWGASRIATTYVLEQSVNGGAWGVVSDRYTTTSTTVTVPATGNYKYQVSACGVGGCSGYTVSGNVAVTLPPGAAPHLSGPSSSTTGTFTLSWNTVSGATRYQLNQNLNGTVTTPYNAGGTSWSSSNLANGNYNYQVFACNVAGCGPGSNGIAVNVLHIPAMPSYVTAPQQAPYPGNPWSIGISPVTGASSYNLRRTDTESGAATVKTGVGTSTHDYTLPGVYQYSGQACNASGCSSWKNASNKTTVYCTMGNASPEDVQPDVGCD